ncbi:nickel/cobalt transporter [Actibacterium sp. D379-3]
MRPVLLIAPALAVAALAAFWGLGGFDDLTRWAGQGQREFQNAMARSLRALRGGQPGAWAALMGIAFAYGFFHAAGPGHGKVLIGGYGVGRQVGMVRLAAIALAASLAQATSAVALVYAGVLLFDWTREQMVGVTEQVMAPLSYGAIGLIGLWLLWRGGRRLWRQGRGAAHHDGHDHGADCGCGHAHGPTPAQVAQLHGLRDAALLIGGIALRPCTGALFLLILTWRMGIGGAGVAGAYAMGLGTASVTVLVAVLAVGLRGGTLAALTETRALRYMVPALELAAGGLVALVAWELLRTAL